MRQFSKKYWPIMGIGIMLTLIVYYLIKMGYGPAENPQGQDSTQEGGIRLNNIHYVQKNTDEKNLWILDAEKIIFSKNRQSLSFENFQLNIEPQYSAPLELKGRKGDYDKNSTEMNLWGNLEGYIQDHYRMYAEHIIYQQNKSYVTSEQKVRIEGPFFSVNGRGLQVDLDKKVVKILSNVTTYIDRESTDL